jgi:hypothetical protein
VTQCEFPGVADRDSAEEEGEYFRAAAHLLQELATEVRPLAQLSADMAMAIEALQQSVESLVSIVNFIPIAVDATCLIELKELARTFKALRSRRSSSHRARGSASPRK